ncbi:hypothetical protein [Psychrobacillus sp. FSL K6-1464]
MKFWIFSSVIIVIIAFSSYHITNSQEEIAPGDFVEYPIAMEGKSLI